jgi:hypothetical protein
MTAASRFVDTAASSPVIPSFFLTTIQIGKPSTTTHTKGIDIAGSRLLPASA